MAEAEPTASADAGAPRFLRGPHESIVVAQLLRAVGLFGLQDNDRPPTIEQLRGAMAAAAEGFVFFAEELQRVEGHAPSRAFAVFTVQSFLENQEPAHG